MKLFQSKRDAPAAGETPLKADRRSLVVGTGVAGAAAIAAHLLHRGAVEAPVATVAKAVPAQGDGYRLTAHVQRYYETTKA